MSIKFTDREENIRKMAAMAEQELPLNIESVYPPGQPRRSKEVSEVRHSLACKPSHNDPLVRLVREFNEDREMLFWNFRRSP